MNYNKIGINWYVRNGYFPTPGDNAHIAYQFNFGSQRNFHSLKTGIIELPRGNDFRLVLPSDEGRVLVPGVEWDRNVLETIRDANLEKVVSSMNYALIHIFANSASGGFMRGSSQINPLINVNPR